MYNIIVSAKFKNFFVAPDALQQNKSGPKPKKVGNHCTTHIIVSPNRHTLQQTLHKFCHKFMAVNG